MGGGHGRNQEGLEWRLVQEGASGGWSVRAVVGDPETLNKPERNRVELSN
jgi:hypothetical protein